MIPRGRLLEEKFQIFDPFLTSRFFNFTPTTNNATKIPSSSKLGPYNSVWNEELQIFLPKDPALLRNFLTDDTTGKPCKEKLREYLEELFKWASSNDISDAECALAKYHSKKYLIYKGEFIKENILSLPVYRDAILDLKKIVNLLHRPTYFPHKIQANIREFFRNFDKCSPAFHTNTELTRMALEAEFDIGIKFLQIRRNIARTVINNGIVTVNSESKSGIPFILGTVDIHYEIAVLNYNAKRLHIPLDKDPYAIALMQANDRILNALYEHFNINILGKINTENILNYIIDDIELSSLHEEIKQPDLYNNAIERLTLTLKLFGEDEDFSLDKIIALDETSQPIGLRKNAEFYIWHTLFKRLHNSGYFDISSLLKKANENNTTFHFLINQTLKLAIITLPDKRIVSFFSYLLDICWYNPQPQDVESFCNNFDKSKLSLSQTQEIIKHLKDSITENYQSDLPELTPSQYRYLLLIVGICLKQKLIAPIYEALFGRKLEGVENLLDRLSIYDLDKTISILKENFDINLSDFLCLAIKLNKFNLALGLLNYVNNLNYIDKNHKTPLWYAAANGNIALVKLLITKGALKSLQFPFLVALENDHIEIAKLLLQRNMVILRASSIIRSVKCLKNLLKCYPTTFKDILLYYAVNSYEDRSEAIKLLVTATNINQKVGPDREPPINIAISKTISLNNKNVMTLLQLGANPNQMNSKNENSLILCLRQLKPLFNICESLLIAGADPNQSDITGNTAATYAIELGNDKIMSLLFLYKTSSYDALEYACREEDLMKRRNCIEWLIKSGCNINDFGKHDETILMKAIQLKDSSLVKLLIELKSDPYLKNSNHENAFTKAYRLYENHPSNESVEIINILDCRGNNAVKLIETNCDQYLKYMQDKFVSDPKDLGAHKRIKVLKSLIQCLNSRETWKYRLEVFTKHFHELKKDLTVSRNTLNRFFGVKSIKGSALCELIENTLTNYFNFANSPVKAIQNRQ